MRIRELLGTGRPSISFEFFPPKDDAGYQALLTTIDSLRELKPTYISVTYGAGGSTRRQTVELVGELKQKHAIEPMAHLTCLGAPQSEIADVLERLAEQGVENVLALRGDPPRGQTHFVPHPEGFRYAVELAKFARARFKFCLGGACYPEMHPEALSPEADLDNLRRKADAGCEFFVSQLFFDNRVYFDFVARVRSLGIGAPIIPGIMPITNVAQVDRFTKMCGASIPPGLRRELGRLQDDPNAVLALGVAHATAQCLELLQRGAPGIHFYTLNRSPATRTILTAIQNMYPPAQTPAGSWV
jgi:methylenetetrahydrofolate reductase (NADPH)